MSLPSIPIFLTPVRVVAGTLTLLAILFWVRRRTSKQALPYPPGPRALPLIGNLLDIPQSNYAIAWTKMGKKYGPLTWLTIPGQTVLVINAFEAAKELLEKRPLIYVDRPRFAMADELLGLGNYLPISPYNDTYKKQRVHLKHALSASVVRNNYSSLLETKARQYVERCTARPENILPETTRIIGEAIILLTYGKLVDERGRDYIQLTTRLLDIMIFSLQGYVVDIFPVVQYLPSWLPGMKFKRNAARWRKEICELENTMFELVKENKLSNDPQVQSSFILKRMRDLQEKNKEVQDAQQRRNEETLLVFSGLQMYLGALETTEATMQTFIRAMTLFPSVQKQAQAEIGRVIGSCRLPSFEDQPDLPYIHAVVLETMRWNPVLPVNVPHASRKDDIYEGYFIPKGTGVIANAWGFSRDPKYYTNPSTFDPERFLKQTPELDPREFVFGYGRRICPGQDFGFQEVWILIATIFWAFEVVGEDKPAPFVDEDLFLFGMVNRPKPFKCRFVPRREAWKDSLGFACA